MRNLNDFSDFQLQTKAIKTVFGGTRDNGIMNGNCTPDPIGDEIRKKLGL